MASSNDIFEQISYRLNIQICIESTRFLFAAPYYAKFYIQYLGM